MNPIAFPTWDALIDDPALFEAQPADVQQFLYEQVATLEARLRAKLLRPWAVPATVSTPERAVRIDEAAALMSMSKDYLYRHWKTLGGFRDDDCHIKFALSTVQLHIRRAARR